MSDEAEWAKQMAAPVTVKDLKFDAKAAIAASEDWRKNATNRILNQIKSKAEIGKRSIEMDIPEREVRESLRSLGFKVEPVVTTKWGSEHLQTISW